MTDQNESNQPQLTLSDPIDPDTIKRFQQLQSSRLQIADHLLGMEQEKVRLLRAAQNVEAERQRLFEGVLLARGLPPNFPVEIDALTGVIKPIEEAMEAFNRQASAQAMAVTQANQAEVAPETPVN
jgi:hypothetical protein